MYIELYVKRREAKETQEDAGKHIGVSAVTYSRKERGIHDFTLREAKTLAEKYDCTIDELFKVEESA